MFLKMYIDNEAIITDIIDQEYLERTKDAIKGIGAKEYSIC